MDPRVVGDACLTVGHPTEDEQQVAETVEVFDRVGRDCRAGLHRKRDDAAFGPATDRPGHMKGGSQGRAGGKDEALQRLECRLMAVDLDLEGLDVPGRDPLLGGVGRGQLRAQVEELALHAAEQGIECRRHRMGAGHAEVAVELVHRPEGLDSRMILANPWPAKEARLARVSGLGVDLHGARTSCMGNPRTYTGSHDEIVQLGG